MGCCAVREQVSEVDYLYTGFFITNVFLYGQKGGQAQQHELPVISACELHGYTLTQ